MKKYYSAMTGGFYSQEIHGDAMPLDAKEVEEEQYAALLSAQSKGKQIISDGNGFPVAVSPPITPQLVPAAVQAWQAKTALLEADLLDDVETIMADPTTDRKIIIAWQGAPDFRRDSPMITALSAKLKLTDKQVDDLFFAAAAV